MSVYYADEAKLKDGSIVPRQGLIKVVNRTSDLDVICQRQTNRTDKSKIEITQK